MLAGIIGILIVTIVFIGTAYFIRAQYKRSEEPEDELDDLYHEWDEDERDLTSPETPIPKLIRDLNFDIQSTKAQIRAARNESKIIREYEEAKELSKRVEVERRAKP